MRFHRYAVAILLTLVVPVIAQAQLYTEDFDTDNSANWLLKSNEAFGQSPSDGAGEPDATADFFFNYNDVGIPSAPNSTGGSTRGMKIQGNLIAGIFGGVSASPIGQSFTGDYKLTFDMWGNYVGDPVQGLAIGGNAQTTMATAGIMADGNTGVAPGVQEGVWFGATVDGFSTADYRAYSKEREISYQLPPTATPLDAIGQPVDGHATYHNVTTRNSSETFYSTNFGSVTAPAAQVSAFPQQLGTTPAGSIGMEWHEVEIAKVGNVVTWTMDGFLLITVDGTNTVTDRIPDGSNIFFGHSDINAGSSAEPSRFDLQFILFDNVVVEAIADPGLDGDHNGDGTVDAADYVLWRKDPANHGGEPGGYDDWKANFAETGPGSGGSGAVPEPGTAALAIVSLLMTGLFGRRRG